MTPAEAALPVVKAPVVEGGAGWGGATASLLTTASVAERCFSPALPLSHAGPPLDLPILHSTLRL